MTHSSSKTRYNKLSEDDEEANLLAVGVPSSSPSDSLEKGSCKLNKQKKIRFCCYIVSAILGLFLLLTVATSAYGYFWTRYQVKHYTVLQTGENGLHFPIHEMSPAELEVVKDRFELFWDTIKAGQVPEKDLVVTADEINGFIAHSDYLRGNAYVTLEDNFDGESSSFRVEMNLPADKLPGGNGRAFVATGRLDVNPRVEHDGETGALLTLQVDAASPTKAPTTLNGDLFLYWQNHNNNDGAHYELIMNVLRGEFHGNRRGKPRVSQVSQEFIGRKENLLHILYHDEEEHHHHHRLHDHDSHRHDHHHHHHHHHHDDDDDDCSLTKVMDGIESISIQKGAVAVHARRNMNNKTNKMGNGNVNNNNMNMNNNNNQMSAWSVSTGRKLKALSNWIL